MNSHLQDSLGKLLHDATRLMRKRFEERAAAHGLSSAQWRLMFAVARDGAINQARLSERLEIEPISVSRLVDRMEEAGWVRREPDPSDRRGKLVVPTGRTLAIFDEVRAVANAVYDEALAGVDPEARNIFMTTLIRVVDNLSGSCATEDRADKEAAQ